jgi:hypothetical protein
MVVLMICDEIWNEFLWQGIVWGIEIQMRDRRSKI